ncbi:hypothetical protein B566_EDAN002766 [Ephemera danica]|nr:hypothetical protein B566_EDAN002766 [Ephemera danica]
MSGLKSVVEEDGEWLGQVDEAWDTEWDDFARLLAEFQHRRAAAASTSGTTLGDGAQSSSGMLRLQHRGSCKPSSEYLVYPNVYTGQSADDEDSDEDDLDYVQTMMYGRYTKELGEFAKEEARRLKALEKRRRRDDKRRNKELQKYRGACATRVLSAGAFLWRHTFARLGEDWVFLALLGVIMAFLSFGMDMGIGMCNKARMWLYRDLANHEVMQYFAWICLPVFLILFSAGFVHIVAPQSIGSGIPEMKTILRGVALKEYLTFRTLVAKIIGLTATLGSGMPLGKEGPFVHIASIVAQLLSKLVTSFQGIYENESRNCEMLAAACAVGVASCFAAPIGGVLFSIEVTTVYFAVRNYWRGFFAAVCGATVFRLLAVWFQKEATITTVFATNFTMDFPFDPQELIVFALIGRFLYPGVVALMVASCSYPPGIGQFMAGDLTTHQQVVQLFSNFTWTKENVTVQEAEILSHWTTDYSGIGAAFGRAVGELMHMWFPDGVRYGGGLSPIIPGGYATVGAAAYSGAIAVLISNAIAALLQPSLYDSIILIKKLPYLPDLLPSSSGMYHVYVDDFMVREVKYIWHGITYGQLKDILKENRNLRSFPLVDRPDNMILLGSVQRLELIKLIDRQIGRERRLQVAAKWQKEAQERALEELERQKRVEEARLERQRRPSRFEVVPAPDILKLKTQSTNELAPPKINADVRLCHPLQGQPKKSILKKTNSFNLRFSPLLSPHANSYSTVTGAESRMRLAFEAVFRKSATLQDVEPTGGSTPGSVTGLAPNFAGCMATGDRVDSPSMASMATLTIPATPTTLKKVQLPRERVIDMSPEDQKQWEEEELRKSVVFEKCPVDPAPFQLVERTSLLKVHSLFSMLGVNHAYVTAIGRLVGVVALKELRKAIEDSNAGNLPLPSKDPNESPDPCANELLGAGEETQNTITSMDSALSSCPPSENGQDSRM